MTPLRLVRSPLRGAQQLRSLSLAQLVVVAVVAAHGFEVALVQLQPQQRRSRQPASLRRPHRLWQLGPLPAGVLNALRDGLV